MVLVCGARQVLLQYIADESLRSVNGSRLPPLSDDTHEDDDGDNEDNTKIVAAARGLAIAVRVVRGDEEIARGGHVEALDIALGDQVRCSFP